MSRCFPYPPPGYVVSSATQDALIESIKLQKDKVKAEEHKKDKKREKKERKKDKKHKRDKKEKKDKKSQIKDTSDAVLGHLDKKFKADPEITFLQKEFKANPEINFLQKEFKANPEINFLQKEIKAETEQLESSSLTEEHAKPVCLRVPSSSSDSTENSNKRKRQPSPVDVSRGHGKIIRIRLSSKKHNQPNALLNEEKHCSTSGRTHVPPQFENEIAPRLRSEGFCSTSGSNGSIGQSLVFKTGGERFHIASKQIETASPPQLETKALPPVMTAMQEECLLYRSLIENWVPPQMNDLCAETGDDDWLFGSKTKTAKVSEKSRVFRDESVSSCSNASLLWPRAQYLGEVDSYALPYTVPF